MTADERPTPPSELDRTGREALDELAGRDAPTLRAVSDYLEELAAWNERRTDRETGSATAEPDAYPDDVPERASVSVTEIGGTEYYYYQWRDGDEIRSHTERR
ncbi:hypothetical protein [Natrinema salaciae]|uniref:Uncharacterized protein n=1 Tax=Natrinema salaciae TaxID=1186196 RepID=A0A1H9SFK6_9EURY|nr:hypothetical protein [Natrinema salaciae]SER83800.1 hypothetical protein SAMN04489841_4713 [Natrinema salaciae]